MAEGLEEILKGMLEMQAKTNDTLSKLSEKLDDLSKKSEQVATDEGGMKSEEDMHKELTNSSHKIVERKMYKLIKLERSLPLGQEDTYNDGGFTDGGQIWKDLNKRFDSEKEAKEYCEKEGIKNFKLMPVTVPVPEGQEYKVRRPNLYI